MIKNIYIIYNKYYNFDKNYFTIGGVQTYITDLSSILVNEKFIVHIIQAGSEDRRTCINEVEIIEYKINEKNSREALCKKLYKDIDVKQDLIIFGSDTMMPKNNMFFRSIAIQHGICWDIPNNSNRSTIRVLASRAKNAFNIIKRLNRVQKVVCVDYNFLNWYRTQVDKVLNNFSVIPNYSQIAPITEKPDDCINIIFARRLYEYRGTKIFTAAIKRILDEGRSINVTIAGSGADEEWMHKQLDQYGNVKFILYESKDSLKIHNSQHIAVVPTIGSEGTSLSLLEAMSAQCAVVCTNVGGMTNIIINGYNGLMVNASDIEQLYLAIVDLVEHPEKRKRLAEKGYETLKSSFSYERWKDQWIKVLQIYK